MRPKKLVWQLYSGFLIIIIIPAILFTWYTTKTFRQFFISDTIESLTEHAYQLSSHIEGYPAAMQNTVADSLCKYLIKKIPTRFTVIQRDGTVSGESEIDPESMENHANRTEVIAAFNGTVGISERFSHTLDEKMLYVAVPVYKNNAVSGVVRASISISKIQNELSKMYSRIVFGFLVVAIIAAFVSYIISRRISRPIDAMKRGAKRFAQGDFSIKLVPSGCEEIDDLTNVLNNMALTLRDTISSLKEHRNRIDAVLSSMVEGVIALDKEQTVIAVNNAAVKLFGLSSRPETGTWIGKYFRNSSLLHFTKDIIDRGEPADEETSITTMQNATGYSMKYELQLHGNALKDASGNIIGALVVINDVTRLKKLETVRSDFVANVSHELRTPLTSVKGFVETLLGGAIDNREDALHFLNIIERQVERLTTIVQDLLVLSRIEQDDLVQQMEFKNISMSTVVEQALELCNKKAHKKNISIVTDSKDKITASVEPALIEEAIINLVDNAIIYSSEGSTVTVRVTTNTDDNEVILSVEDNGPGISKEHHERIFERFYRVDKARSRKLGGTGLGLSIVKHIAITHGGSVALESAPGKGSTFSLHIPKNEAPKRK